MIGFDVLRLLPAPTESVVLDSAIAVTGPRSQGRQGMTLNAVAIEVTPPLVEVPADGLDLPFDWGPTPAGTDRLELASLNIEVRADPATDFGGYLLGELAAKVSGNELVVPVPAGRRIRALNVGTLTSEKVDFRSEQKLRDSGRRLTVSQRSPGGGWATPVVAVPAVAARGQIPATLTGASFDNGVLRLPDLAGPLKVAIVKGETPEEFVAQPLTAGTVTGWAAPTPVDLTLSGPDGTVLWNFVGPMPDGIRQNVDVKVPVAAAVEVLRAESRPVSGALTLTSAFPCQVRFRTEAVRGALIRDLPGTIAVNLAGEPVALPLDRPLPADVPDSVVADVAVRYAGLRLADVSDPLPPAGAQHGVVVRREAVQRLLPPLALRGERVSRIGLVGFCPQPSALLVRLIPAPIAGASATAALGTPGTVTVEPSTTIGVIWVELPEPVLVDRAAAIEVSAGSGRLNWVADPHPLVRLVVLDPDPGGRPVVLGAGTLLSVSQPELRTIRASLPAGPFAAGIPLVASALFATVEITDAELRYPRGA